MPRTGQTVGGQPPASVPPIDGDDQNEQRSVIQNQEHQQLPGCHEQLGIGDVGAEPDERIYQLEAEQLSHTHQQ